MKKPTIILLAVIGTLVSGTLVTVVVDYFSPKEMIKGFFGGFFNTRKSISQNIEIQSQLQSEIQEKVKSGFENSQQQYQSAIEGILPYNGVYGEGSLDYSLYGNAYIQPEEFYPGTDVPSFAYLADVSEAVPSYRQNYWHTQANIGNFIKDVTATYSYSGMLIDDEIQKTAVDKLCQKLVDSGYVTFTEFEKFGVFEIEGSFAYVKGYTFVQIRFVGGGPHIEIALNFFRPDNSEFVKFPIENKRTSEQVMPPVEDRPTSPIAIESLEWYEGFEGTVPKIDQFLTTKPQNGKPYVNNNGEYDLSISVLGERNKSSGFEQSFEDFKTTLLALGYVEEGNGYFYLYGEDKIVKIYAYWAVVDSIGSEDIYISVYDDYDLIYGN